jgi:hypothetical protein
VVHTGDQVPDDQRIKLSARGHLENPKCDVIAQGSVVNVRNLHGFECIGNGENSRSKRNERAS